MIHAWPSGHPNQFGSDKQLEKSRDESSSRDPLSRSRRWAGGIASEAVRLFITTEQQRLMYARAATHNLGSRKVLERTGFTRVGGEISWAAGIGKDVSEFIYRLD